MKISRTALSMAFFRALETARGPDVRLFSDPFAAKFLPRMLQAICFAARNSFVQNWVARAVDWRYPGARTSGIARTRLIDDWLVAEIQSGAEQLLILGSGFDSRSLRLVACSKVITYELDQPQMVDMKERTLARWVNDASPRRRILAVNFLNDDIEEKLLSAGFQPGKRTAVIWEGVTNYLDASSVAATLTSLSKICCADSRLIFTYVEQTALPHHDQDQYLVRLHTRLAHWGEAWTFGIDPRETASLLAQFSFSLEADLGANEYRRLYYGSRASDQWGYEFYRLVRCVIKHPHEDVRNATS